MKTESLTPPAPTSESQSNGGAIVRERATASAQVPDCSGIVMVDDDLEILKAGVQALRDEGHVVLGARGGLEALKLLRAMSDRPPCLILLDLMMPEMDGREFRAQQLRDPRLAAIPVVLFSAGTELERDATEMMVEAILAKPVSLERLLSVVRRYCPPGHRRL